MIVLGIVVFLSITQPQHNLFVWQMLIGTALGTLVFIGAFFLWDHIPCKQSKKNAFLYVFLLILYGVLLYLVSCANRNAPWSLVDYGHVWNAASELSAGKPISAENYFKTYANNIKPMLYLSVLFKIAKLLHINDPFYFVLFFSVMEILGAVLSVNILAGNSKENQVKNRIPILFLFIFTLPIWANVQAFYTDGMTFITGIITLALIKLCLESSSRIKAVLLLTIAGIFAGIGASIKITILIPILAGFIIFCFSNPIWREWRYILLFILCTIIVYGLTSLWAEKFTIWEAAKNTSEPIIDWVALGMKGNGSYGDNLDYINFVTTLSSKHEKIEYTLQYIWENRSDFWNCPHLVQKIRYNFASGSFGIKDFTYYALKEHNLIWELFSPWGKYYWRTSQLCFCYIFSIYTIYTLGAAVTLYNIFKKSELSPVKAIADLTILGNFIFLMIWEANNRQLYNQLPVILLGAIMNVHQIIELKTNMNNAHT